MPSIVPTPVAVTPKLSIPGPVTTPELDSLIRTLTLEQKIGQLIMPWLSGAYASFDSEALERAQQWIDSFEIGGIIVSVGSPLDVGSKLNRLQTLSHLPLLIAADLEWGAGMRLIGGTAFPMSMALGATDSELDAYQMGRVTALEARAVGIHLTFSPVADLNSNPENPIINTRSLGEDPAAVSRLIRAYIQGASDHGLYTTAKHFPGHGDTGTDSHIDVPVLDACWDRLDSLELVPFRAAIQAGVTAVMTAHIALPCFHEDRGLPATLSPEFMTGILRDSLGFQGLVVTDALIMGAIVTEYGGGESAVRAFEAGSDLLLMPAAIPEAIAALADAVHSGRISTERVDSSVRRMLALKRAAGLFQSRTVDLNVLPQIVGNREFREIADDIAARALTLVQVGEIDSFRTNSGRMALITYAEETNLTIGGVLAGRLREHGDTVNAFRLYPSSGTLSLDSARAIIADNPRVVFASSVRFIAWRGHIALPDSIAALMLETAAEQPTVIVSLGSPYLLNQLPGYDGTYLLAWSDVRATERAIADALAGRIGIAGRTRIHLSDQHPKGHGHVLSPHRLGFDGAMLDSVSRYLDSEVARGSFPGAVLVAGRANSAVFTYATGVLGEDDRRSVTDSTIYDIASITKVIGLTTAVMLLVSDGVLDLDAPVQRYVPEFMGLNKADVLVRHLLTHSSGLPAWRPLYQEASDRNTALSIVYTTELEGTPENAYVYSDLGVILLTQVVERAAGERIDSLLARRVFEPLGMHETQFRPSSELLERIAPTERDPWRGRVLRGEVHDENAHRLGGISGHAGLFSTAPDLAKFARWMVDAYHGRHPTGNEPNIPMEVVREFTRRQEIPRGSTRALGWDTPSVQGSSAGTLLSRSSFGHTGFTGTSIWIDPEQDIFVILLTNRVHPTRENNAIRRVRPRVADFIARAIQQAAS